MYYIATFNEATNEPERITFDDFSKAWEYTVENGFEKFRDLKGNEYFIWK